MGRVSAWLPLASLLGLAVAGCAAPAGARQAGGAPGAAIVGRIKRQAASDYPGIDRDKGFEAVTRAIATLDRSRFVPPGEKRQAQDDRPLSIGYGQTISDPYIVALMSWAVAAGSGSNVLEIGTGSGYQAALLDRLGARVHTIEIVPQLAQQAAERLKRMGMERVTVRTGDGFAGWPQFAPFDAIIVTAGSSDVPAPLLAQLRMGGKLVMPLGANSYVEQLVVYTKEPGGDFDRCSLGPVMFVPLTGRGERPDMPGLYNRDIKLCWPGQRARWPGQKPG